jgi:putative proteasome-type protease
VIGNSGHGKAILNRVLNEDSDMKLALKAGFLSFDSTRVSSNNVDFPIDVALYKKGTFELIEQRYTQRDMADISAQWDEELKNALINVPGEWMDKAFKKLPK